MKGTFRIPVYQGGGTSNPDPAVYCPANGYILNPDIYQPETIIENEPLPGTGEIKLLVSDLGDRNIKFNCSVSSSAKYVVTVYGLGDTVIETQTITNNGYFETILPYGEGYAATGYTYYSVVIKPEIGTNNITVFRAWVNSGYDANGADIFACFFNAPNLTSLTQAFYQMKKLRYVEFLCDCDSLTTLYRAFYQCDSLQKVILPGSMAACTSLSDTFLSTLSLQEVVMPTSLPSCTTIYNIFYSSNIGGTVTFPSSMPEVTTMTQMFYLCSNIKNVVLPSSAPKLLALNSAFVSCSKLETVSIPIDAILITNLQYTFRYCYSLTGNFVFPEMNNLTTAQGAFQDCYKVSSIEFVGEADLCSNLQYFVFNCKVLTSLKLPTSLNALINVSYFALFNNNYELTYLRLPDSWNPVSDYTSPTAALFNSFSGCFKLATITSVTTARAANCGILSSTSLYALEQWNQPNLRHVNVTLKPSGGTIDNSIRGLLNYFQIDFSILYDLKLQWNSLPKIEVERIISLLPPQGNAQNPVYFYIMGNIASIQANSVGMSGVKYSAYVFRANSTPNPTPIIGQEFQMSAQSRQVGVTFTASGSFCTTTIDHGFLAGRKIVFTYSVLSVGINYNQEYFIINPSGSTFQISETEGGSAVSFLVNTTGYYVVKILVTGVSGSDITVDTILQSASFTNAQISDMSYYTAAKKGWVLNEWNS